MAGVIETPREVIQPDPQAMLFESLIGKLIGNIFVFFFVGLFISVMRQSFVTGFAIGIGIIVLLTIGQIWWAKTKVNNTEYRILEESIESETGILSTEIRNVRFDEITDISKRQSIIERRFGLGQVRVSTAGSDGKSIKMKDIPNHDEVYEDLRKKQNQSE